MCLHSFDHRTDGPSLYHGLSVFGCLVTMHMKKKCCVCASFCCVQQNKMFLMAPHPLLTTSSLLIWTSITFKIPWMSSGSPAIFLLSSVQVFVKFIFSFVHHFFPLFLFLPLEVKFLRAPHPFLHAKVSSAWQLKAFAIALIAPFSPAICLFQAIITWSYKRNKVFFCFCFCYSL